MAQTDRRTEAEEAADRLDRAWDDLLAAAPAGDRTSPDGHPGGPASGMVLAVRRLHALDDAPAPDPVFAARLRREVLGEADAPAPRGGARVGLVPFAGRPSLVELVAAAAVVLILIGGQLSGRGLVPTVSASPTVAAEAPPVPTAAAVACHRHRAGAAQTPTPGAERGPLPTSPCGSKAE